MSYKINWIRGNVPKHDGKYLITLTSELTNLDELVNGKWKDYSRGDITAYCEFKLPDSYNMEDELEELQAEKIITGDRLDKIVKLIMDKYSVPQGILYEYQELCKNLYMAFYVINELKFLIEKEVDK